jgi:hypothetical protein
MDRQSFANLLTQIQIKEVHKAFAKARPNRPPYLQGFTPVSSSASDLNLFIHDLLIVLIYHKEMRCT